MAEAAKRLESLIGTDRLKKLEESTVMIVGVGGVGGFACEALARSFVGRLILIDNDVVSESNLNRQIVALQSTIGLPKVEVMKQRILAINPKCQVITIQDFYKKDNKFCFEIKPDYVIDAIDTLSSKMDLIEQCYELNIPIISSLGMGNRLDPSQLEVTTLDKTSYDPLAKALRTLAKKRGFKKKIKVVFSKEVPIRHTALINQEGTTRKEMFPPSSSAFVPSAAGLLLASYVVRKRIEEK